MCEIERMMKSELGELDAEDKEVLENMRDFERISNEILLLL